MNENDTWNMFLAHAFSAHRADGFCRSQAIERAARDADALLAESKKRETPPESNTTPPDDGGWIRWGGGECPVPEGTIVKVKFRDGRIFCLNNALNVDWRHEFGSADIVAYRAAEVAS